MTQAPRSKLRYSFSLVELLMVIAILAVLISLLMPSLRDLNYTQKVLLCSTKLKDIHMVWTLYADDNNDSYPHLEYTSGSGVTRRQQPYELTTNEHWPVDNPNHVKYYTHYLNGKLEAYISAGDVPDHLKIFSLTNCPLASPAYQKFKDGVYAQKDPIRKVGHVASPYLVFAGAEGGPVRLGETWLQPIGDGVGWDPVEVNIMAGEMLGHGSTIKITHPAKPGAGFVDEEVPADWTYYRFFPGAEHRTNYLLDDGSVNTLDFDLGNITTYRAYVKPKREDHTLFISSWTGPILPYEAIVKDYND